MRTLDDLNNDGPFAFPFVVTGQVCSGMTLRDYFAAKALQGVLAKGKYEMHPENRAIEAYALADAMLAERAK